MPGSSPLKLFIIYAREDQPALLELKAHLRPLEKRGDLTVWYDGEILPGQDWDKEVKVNLRLADIVLLFISKHFFNSEYIEKEELQAALDWHKKGGVVVIPVILKPCLWDAHSEIRSLQVLPKDGKPVSSWEETDEAWADIARGIQRVLDKIVRPIEIYEQIATTDFNPKNLNHTLLLSSIQKLERDVEQHEAKIIELQNIRIDYVGVAWADREKKIQSLRWEIFSNIRLLKLLQNEVLKLENNMK